MPVFNKISEVNEHLYIAPARALNVDILKDLGITCVINATCEIPNIHIEDVEFIQVPIEDSSSTNIAIHFDELSDKIDEVHQQGGKTLVHCVAGASRSASLCIAYLMKYQHMKLREAFCYLKSRRQYIRPNSGFFEQLISYEKVLYGSNTVKMIPMPGISDSSSQIPDIYMEECKGFIWLKSFKHIVKPNN